MGLRPGEQIELVEARRGFRVQKQVPASPFEKYLGYLRHLADNDLDDEVEQVRGR